MEPEGHTFSGEVVPGQVLQIAVSPDLMTQLEQIPRAERMPWNTLPGGFRVGNVKNLQRSKGLEQGISGGPLYDPELRKVTGLFRAVEGEEQAYVIPIDEVFRGWDDLKPANERLVVDEPIDKLQSQYGVQRVGEGARPVRAPGADYFEQLFAYHKPFGGRQSDIERLNQSIHDQLQHYFFVTGPAGFGKTALLANWTQSLLSNKVEVAVHFLTRLIDGGTEAAFCFENLCEQLMRFHGLGGELPTSARKLRLLYTELLRLSPPPEKRLVVVLDGLDEALDLWNPEADMFPQNLPVGIQIVFSARTIADRNWLESLGLELTEECILSVGKLDKPDIREILNDSNIGSWTADELMQLTDRLQEISEGDPFYLNDLLSELKGDSHDLERISAYPIGHNNYLQQWWDTAHVEDEAFVDLMGLLTVAHGSLQKEQLVDICETDNVRSLTINKPFKSAARYIIGTEDEGYRLPHSRIQEFIESRFGRDIRIYENRMADYCLRWADNSITDQARTYILSYAARHLADVDQYETLIGFLEHRWMIAKWKQDGSYASLIEDLNLAANLAFQQDPPDSARVAALAVARGTARTIMTQFPAEILTALIRLGQRDQVVEMLKAERDIASGEPDRNINRLINIAIQLVRSSGNAALTADPDLREFVLGLLGRAWGSALDRETPPEFQLHALRRLLKVLGPILSHMAEHERSLWLEQIAGEPTMQEVAERSGDPAFLCSVYSLLAETVVDIPAERSLFDHLVQEANARVSDIAPGPDYLVAMAYLLPVTARSNATDYPIDAAEAALEAVINPFEPSYLDRNPICALLSRARLQTIRDRAAASNLVKAVGDLALRQEQISGDVASCVVQSLLDLGELAPATKIVSDAWENSPGVASTVVTLAARELYQVVPDVTIDWIEKSATYLEQNELEGAVVAWASIGRWDRALAEIELAAPGTPRRAASVFDLLNFLVEMDDSPDDAVSVVAQLVELSSEMAVDYRTMILAMAAGILAPTDRSLAMGYIERAIGLQLAEFPTGDTDVLQEFLAVAFHQDGKFNDAARVVDQIASPEAKIRALSTLMVFTSSNDTSAVELYCASILTFLETKGVSASFDTLRGAISLFLQLEHKAPSVATSLYEQVETHARELLESMDRPFQRIAANPWLLSDLGWSNFSNLVRLVGEISAILPDDARSVLERVRAIASTQEPVEAKEVLIAYWREMAAYDPENSAQFFHSELEEAAKRTSDSWIEFISSNLGPAIVHFSRFHAEAAGDLVASLLETVLKIQNPRILANALSQYWQELGELDDEVRDSHPELYSDALDATIKRLPDGDLRATVAESAVQSLVTIGNIAAARQAIESLSDPEDKGIAGGPIDDLETLHQLGELSPLEEFYVSQGGMFPLGVLTKIRASNDAKKQFHVFVRALANDLIIGDREVLITVGVWSALMPVWYLEGTSAIEAIVAAIDDFDDRFLEAAKDFSQTSV